MIRLIRKTNIQFSADKSKTINKPIVDYTQRGQYRSPLNLKKGDRISSFQVIKRSKLLDFQIDLAVFKCNQYGTEWVHFDCEQQKNSLGFVIKCHDAPQMAKLSIQRLLQCGSKKYPVRNPIEFMTRRSFNPQNFSFSTNEYIFYGYQTTLLRDHNNLMDVFMHMMHSPLLRYEDFRDIVWRYSLRNDQKLEIEGDIANEVKSLWNTSQIKIFDAIQKHILDRQGFPDPLNITKLQFEDIINWHKKMFHPQNMIIITHGDLHPTKIIDKYSKVCQELSFKQKYPVCIDSKKSTIPQRFTHFEQTKTLKIEHLQTNIPFVLSFKIDNISSTQRLLLSILSQILFDMPTSIFMSWNSPQTPYPKHYGFQGKYFNIGVTILQKEKKISEQQFLHEEKLIRDSLLKLYKEKFSNSQIQECLFHLEDAYFTKDGINIMTGCIDNILEQGVQSIEQCFNVKYFISRLLRTYRKQNIFEELLKKHIIQNQNYVRIVGKVNHDLIQDSLFQQQVKLRLIRDTLSQNQLDEIRNYKLPEYLQDYRILPKIDVNEYEIFEQKNPNVFQIRDIPIFHIHKCDGVKLTMRFDITDIQEEDVKLIPIVCQAFPWMGGKGISNEAFRNHIQMYIRNISMKFQTNRTPQGMKMFLFLTIQFSDRNSQFGFNLCNHLINGHDHQNIEALSQRLQKKGAEIFNELSQNLIQIHGQHIGGTRSPHAMMEDPLFSARSICGLASDVLKISNPKLILKQVAQEMKKVTCKFQQKNRISILFQCKNTSLQKYRKYIELMLNPLKQGGGKFDPINDKLFTPTPILKYFPNYEEQFVFEAFSVPYFNNVNEIPTAMVLSAVINQNIKRLNPVGGSFIFKGALISYLRGSRKKVIELQEYYKKIEDIDEAKRSIFQQFRRYTAADLFYTGVMAEEARVLKQAVALVDEQSLQNCLEKYILKDIKEGKSSVLALGPNLGSYEPLIKKGWAIQRSIEQMSLRMESESLSTPKIEMSKYINIY